MLTRLRVLMRRPDVSVRIKLFMEFLVYAGMTYWMFNAVPGVCSPSFACTKLQQLVIAALSSASLYVSGRRWMNRDDVPANSISQVSYAKSFQVVLWVAWLGLSVLAWALFAHGMLWDFEKPFFRSDVLSGNSDVVTGGGSGLAGADKTSGNDSTEIYLAVIGVVITLITAYYLVILHRVTDRAETTLEFLRERYEARLDELHRLLNQEDEFSNQLSFREIELRRTVLIPMLQRLDASIRVPLTRRLFAEISLYRLINASNGADFVRLWSNAKAFEDIFRNHAQTFGYLFGMAYNTLERLLGKGLAVRDDKELREAEYEVLGYVR